MTNFERIKKMNAEELAAELSDVVDECPPSANKLCWGTNKWCDECWLEWLNEEDDV